MSLLKLSWPFLKSFLAGQGRVYAAAAGAYLITHGLAAGYTQDQITGAIFAILAIALQAADNLVVDKKIAIAHATAPDAALPENMQ